MRITIAWEGETRLCPSTSNTRVGVLDAPTSSGLRLSDYCSRGEHLLREGEKLAGLQTQKGTLRHAYRRKWVTERKHLPDVDVAAAGGWKDTESLKTAYQQADQATMLKVVLEAGELREAR